MKEEHLGLVDYIAQVAHEANSAWCLVNGDGSQPPWEYAPDWQKQSAINGVIFHLENPDAGDSASHENWMRVKIEQGWVPGAVKDPDATPPTHPCLCPFDELPPHQQAKDRLFRAIVHALADI